MGHCAVAPKAAVRAFLWQPLALARPFSAVALDSAGFAALRARGTVLVDKTCAIADLLAGDAGMHNATRAFFSRPRKFGKSLTLDVAATMLAAGSLPAGVAPWPGREPVDADEAFGGLAVHARLRAGDPSLRGLLRRAHFVVKLGLGGAQSGTELKGRIISELAGIAGAAFGSALSADVRAAVTPDDAVSILVRAVPRGVPVALLVDEYDSAIIQDVDDGAARAGTKALRSLLMVTKSPDIGARIERCVVTGVARFARTSLFSGANNFKDFTDSPLISRALGFSEKEIRATFPRELARLATSLGTDVDGAVAELSHWYNGYCFDGVTPTYSPYAVLTVLGAGAITERELDAATGTNWLGLAPSAVVEGLAEERLAGVRAVTHEPVDIADLEARRVHVVPLLLQTGLLSLVHGQPHMCRPPNEYARRSLQRMIETALAATPEALAGFAAALRGRDRAAFEAATRLLFEQLPRTLFKRAVEDERGVLREAVYHAALFGALTACAPPGVDVQPQAPTHRGIADIIIRFGGATPPAVWILEVGIGRAGDAAAKLLQPQAYARAAAAALAEVHCCAVLVANVQPATTAAGRAANGDELVSYAWSRRTAEGGFERVAA